MNNNKIKRKFINNFINKNNPNFIKFVESELLTWIHINYGLESKSYMDGDYWNKLFEVFVNIQDELLQDLYFKVYYNKLFFDDNDNMLSFDNISVEEMEDRLDKHILSQYNEEHDKRSPEEYLKEVKERMRENIESVEQD